MTAFRTDRRWTRFAAFPGVLIAMTVAGGALAPAAHASIPAGSWITPAANATVSGTHVSLQFSTKQSAVTFVLPHGNQPATVSGGVASGTFDSTGYSNATITIGAMECDAVTMCSTTNEMVTVSNPTPTPTPAPAPPTFSPDGGAVAPGSVVTVNGSGTYTIQALIDNQSPTTVGANVTLPFGYTLPTNLAAGEHSVRVVATTGANDIVASGATFTFTIPDSTPPVLKDVNFPASYFPFKDGFRDHFFVLFSTNEASTARLTIFSRGKAIAVGTTTVTNTQIVDLRAGTGLKPGLYQWQLTVTDLAGNATNTPMRNVLADRRHTVSHTLTVKTNAASVKFKDLSGSCSSAKRAGTAVVIASLSRCRSGSDRYYDFAFGNFTPTLKSAVDYGTVTIKIASTGKGVLDYYDFFQGKSVGAQVLKQGVTTIKVNDLNIGYPKPVVAIGIGTFGGSKVTVKSFSLSYVYKTLSK